MNPRGHILLFAYYWPPAGGVVVQRWLHMSNHLVEKGWKITVCTSANPDYPILDNTLITQVHPDIEIIAIQGFEPRNWLKKFYTIFGKKEAENLDQQLDGNQDQKGMLQRFILWIRSNLFIPDARVFWAKRAGKKLHNQKLNEVKPDLIITTGPPHSTHLAGLYLAEKWNIPWIADFRDPWMEIEYFRHLVLTGTTYRKHHLLEKKVITSATAVLTVSPSWASLFESKGAKRVEVIFNGYAESDFPDKPIGLMDGFTITHTGSLGSDRFTENLFKVLIELCREDETFANEFHMHFAGNTHPSVIEYISKSGLNDNYTNHGFLSHGKAIELMCKSSLLLLIQNRVSENIKGRIPAKFFEYLASGRQILLIGDTTSDLAGMILKGGYGYVADYDDFEQLKLVIMKARQNKDNYRSNKSAFIEEYSRSNQAEKLQGILYNILTNK